MAKKKRTARSLISGHLGGIRRALLEGEKRPVFLEFLDTQLPAKHGIYALYDKSNRLYYAGKASDLSRRLDQHLKDRLGDSWDRMTLFLVNKTSDVAQLEGLVVAAAKPPGNKRKPKIGQDLRRNLGRYLRRDADAQIDDAVYPEKQRTSDKLANRITEKRLREVGQEKLAQVLGVSQPYISTLFKNRAIRQYIREAGKRDAVLLVLRKAKE
jgi:hypothetical protein